MPLLRLTSIVSVKLKYARPKKGSSLLFFYRRVPDDIKPLLPAGSKYAAKTHYVVSLQTSDPKVAAPRIEKLLKQTTEEWEYLRNPTRAGVRRQAQQLLQRVGFDPMYPEETEEGALWAFEDYLEDQLPQSVREDRTIQHGHQLDRHLSPVHREALQVLQGRRGFTLTDCLDQYVAARPSTDKDARLVFGYLREFLGKDRDIRKVKRQDVNGFVEWLLAGKHSEDGKSISTTTVHRYLNTLRAAFSRAIRENELGLDNVFAAVEIRGKGKDAQQRHPFTVDQLKALHAAVGTWVAVRGWDQLRCIVTVLAETGCRLAEVVGLATADIHLHAATPYIDLKDHPWRSIKATGSSTVSTRKVPLTPRAIAALQAAHKLAQGSAFAFPQYTSEDACKSNSASAALNKWVKAQEGLQGAGLTCHGLRHTMKDLLRAAGCPSDIQDRILGHATPGVGATYGRGHPLEMLADWLAKATAPLATEGTARV
ncbi:tyrosine-type recombinase/integrase [Paraburkholderia azotifigens]|uniref:Tyrosine-type recombinase/integrase n=1 Tax=Paraburkholderia azotifigens TaxID=2057004 RepID=A0ABU9R6M1_9BURK